MQYPIRHLRPLLLVSTVAAVAMSLLLVFAAGAGAESLTTPVAAGEDPAPVEPPPSPTAEAEAAATPSSSIAPAEAPSTGDPSGAAAGDRQVLPPVSRRASSPVSADPSSTAASKAADAAAKPDLAALPTPRISRPTMSKPTGRIRQADAETAGLATGSAKTAAQALDRASPLEPVQALAQRSLQTASSTLQDEALDLLAPSTSQIPLLAASPAGSESGAPPLLPVSDIPSLPSAGALTLEQNVGLDGWLPQYLPEPGDAEVLRLITPSIAGDPGSPQANAAGASFEPLGKRFDNGAPPDGNGPGPLPALPQLMASGASSSFVPVAALLALLALAAPAILRRLREAPGFRAPTPFVCALERPG